MCCVKKPSWQNFLTILALASLAFSQPIFDIISQNPEFLAVRYISIPDILTFVLLIGILTPLLLAAVTLLSSKFLFGEKDGVFYAIFIVLTILIIFPVFKKVFIFNETIRIIITLVFSISVFLVYLRYKIVRDFFGIMSFSVIIFPVYFLFFTPVKNILASNNVQFNPNTYQYGTARKPVSVVFVLLDELSLITLLDEEKNIDSTAFKNISRFFESATWYKNASTISNFTTTAVPSILTGNYPVSVKHKKQRITKNMHDWLNLPIYLDYPDNIFTLLSTTHEMTVREQATQLCPYPLCETEYDKLRKKSNFNTLVTDSLYVYLNIVVPEKLKKHVPNVQMGWVNFDLNNITSDRQQIFMNFVAKLHNKRAKPQFIFLHSILPHMAWTYTSTGEVNGYTSVPGWSSKGWTNDKNILRESYNLYYEQTKFVDALLGRLFDRLKEKKIYHDSLIILTADHGVSLIPGMNSRSVEGESTVAVLSVPLFIHYPGQSESVIDERYATLLDIIPTIADVLDIETVWPTDGLSLLGDKVHDGHKLKFYSPDTEKAGIKVKTFNYKSMSWDESLQRKYRYLQPQTGGDN